MPDIEKLSPLLREVDKAIAKGDRAASRAAMARLWEGMGQEVIDINKLDAAVRCIALNSGWSEWP